VIVTPFRLASGVFLEDQHRLLEWDLPPDPQCETNHLTIRNTVLLGGMAADVVARPKDPLRVVNVYPTILAGAKDETEQFDRVLRELTSRLGPPTHRGTAESSLAAELTYPKASWSFKEVSIEIGVTENNSFAYIPYFHMTLRLKL
jgi:hypothetical protein